MSRPLIETRVLSKHFGGVQAVRGIDFALAEGELRCLIGPNGAGKSTFFKLLTGQLRPTSGRILLRGKDITGAAPHQIARLGVGIKTQIPNVCSGLSVRENLYIAAARGRKHGRVKHIVEETLARVRIDYLADRTVGELRTASASGSRSAPCWRSNPS